MPASLPRVPVSRGEMIEELRERIRRIERHPPRRTAFEATGLPEVDALLPGGGLPRGALTEIAGGPGSGKTALCLAAMARAMREEGLAAFVDGRGELYPPAAAALGVDLGRLLIVRLAPSRDAAASGGRDPVSPGRQAPPAGLWATEVLLGSGAFAAVAVDVPLRGLPPARLTDMLRRLRAAAEKGGTAALLIGATGAGALSGMNRIDLDEVRRSAGRPGRAAGAGEGSRVA
jgi:protein ImuA